MTELYKPSRDDLWFRQALMADEETMSYNAAWGGTIPFPEEDWGDWYDWWLVDHGGERFYRYLVDVESGEFVGEVAYHYDEGERAYFANVIVAASNRGNGHGHRGLGLLCQAAKDNGVKVLWDDIAHGNPAIEMFLAFGFVVDHETEQAVYLRKNL